MVRVQSEIKRGFLRQIAEGAKPSRTLREVLLAFQAQIFSPTFKTGRIYLSTSGSGQAASFAIPSAGFSQEQIFALSEEFLDILDFAISCGATDEAGEEATNTLFATMCDDDRLQGVREVQHDHAMLRFPSTRQ